MADRRLLKFSGTVQLNSRSKAFAHKSSQATEEAMRRVLKAVVRIAKQNVAKGKGPSPHDGSADNWGHHWAHEDTGDLAESVQDAIWLQGFLTEGTVFTDLDYGVYLEVGWRQNGHFYRYPWLKPAFLRGMKLLPKLAAESFKYHMSDLDEDRIMNGESIEGWAEAAERWAKQQQENLKPKTQAPEIPSKKAFRLGRHDPKRWRPKKIGRPGDSAELGEKKALDRQRAVNKRRRLESNANDFDADLVRRSRQSGESLSRSTLSAAEVREKYEKEREKIDSARDRDRAKRRAAQEARQREQQRKNEDAIDALNKANADLKAKTQPKVKAVKAPKVSVKPKKKKK